MNSEIFGAAIYACGYTERCWKYHTLRVLSVEDDSI